MSAPRSMRRLAILAGAVATTPFLFVTPATADAAAPSVEELRDFSIEQLGDLQVTSVTKSAQTLSQAPGAIYVITHDDIVRSGQTSIPEILRLAPNLQVAQTSASTYVITARGFSGNASAQNFSDKLLVLIDGRSVYTPLFSGVYWDMQDVLPEDIDHIEVISGPGATLWGANAVNGVINIITRKAAETQGGVFEAGAGDRESSASLQYGGTITPDLAYRLYAKTFYVKDGLTSTGERAHDGWRKPQGGFRLDWTASSTDNLTLQGDAYDGTEAQQGKPDENIVGRNLLARWNHALAGGSALQVQAYYDRTEHDFVLDTYDLDVQHSFALGGRNQIVWGGGVRVSRYTTPSTPAFFFEPSKRTLNLYNLFAQDSVSLSDAVTLILGLKLEDDPYSKVKPLPSVRLSWKLNEHALVWAAVSRAIRSPTPFDRDVVEKLGAMRFLVGGPAFQPEALTAYEAGARAQLFSRVSFSVSGFYNSYNDLRSIEFDPATLFPLRWGNMMKGFTYGVEAWADYQAAPWWRLSGGFDVLEEQLKFRPGSAATLFPSIPGIEQAGDDPEYQASLKSSMNLGSAVTFDADLRYVAALPNPRVPSYVELNSRVAWNVTERVQVALSGRNLLHAYHQEFPAPQAEAVPRSVFAEVRLRF